MTYRDTQLAPRALSAKERRDLKSLSERWALRDPRLTVAQMLRCRRLQRRADLTRPTVTP